MALTAAERARAYRERLASGTKPRPRRRLRKKRLNSSSEQWTPAEELRLRQLAGTVQVREIARILTAEYGVPRTQAAVSVRARILGISLWWDGYSQNDVATIFGVWYRTVERWRTEGLLVATPWEVGRGAGNRNVGPVGQWHFTEDAIRAFCNHFQWAYAVEVMPAGPWRSLAEVAHRADPWLTTADLSRLWDTHVRTICHWVKQGRLPHRRRHAGSGLPKIMVRANDLPGLRAELRQQALSNLRDAIKLREERRRSKAA